MPPVNSAKPKVSLWLPDIGSRPMQPTQAPRVAAISPFGRLRPLTPAIMVSANTNRIVNSGEVNMMAMAASGAVTAIKTMVASMSPMTEL